MIFPDCQNHESIEAHYCCEHCGQYFCSDCIKTKDFGVDYLALICKNCGGRCVDIRPVIDHEAKTFSSPPVFWLQIPRILQYPFRGKGPYILIAGTVFFSLIIVIIKFSIFFKYLGSTILYYMNVASCVNIIRASMVSNNDDPPEWPDLTRWREWTLTGILLSGSALLCYAPGLIYFMIIRSFDGFFWSNVLFSSFYYPMVFLNVCLNESVKSLNPLDNLVAIIRTFPSYACLVIFIWFLFGFKLLLDTVFINIPVLGFVLGVGNFYYFLFAVMRAYGLYYRANKQQLLWG